MKAGNITKNSLPQANNKPIKVSLEKNKSTFLTVIMTALMLAIGLLMVLPFVWMISASLKREIDIFNYPIEWIPKTLMWSNYKAVWMGEHPFYIYYFNSIKVTALQQIGLVITSSLAAYGFSRLKFKGRDILFLLYLSTMMIPHQVVLVPRFIIFKSIGILDTHWALILPGIFTPFGVFMLRQFFLSIPNELSEAAIVDGCNHLKILYKIILPLSKPALVSLFIITFVWHWNNYENALIFLFREKLFTIPVGLNFFLDEYTRSYAMVMAAACSAIIPVLLVFVIGQKQFIQGIATSGLKG